MKKRIVAGMICVLMMVSVLLPTLSENLRYGTHSSQVNQAQSRLAQLGYYKDKVDGMFGYSTYVAVKAFQAKNGLKADGVIGEITNLLLFSEDAISNIGTKPGITLYQRIAYGSAGPAVKTVQGILRNLGYYTQDVEGKFGYSTYQAVTRYQADKGLKVDGVVGPATWASLTGGVPIPSPVPTPTPDLSKPVPGLRVQYNDVGPRVKQIQQKLNDLGYNVGQVDDRFGYLTYQAVQAFQKNNGLKVDGIVGPDTWAKLFGASPVPAPSGGPSASPGLPQPIRLQYNDTGAQVGQLQTRLFELGYYKGAIDSGFGYATYEAVRAFQKNNGLTVDGIVGPDTWTKLFRADAVPTGTVVPSGSPKPSPAPAPTPDHSSAGFRLKYEDKSPQVGQLQSRLAALGYMAASGVDNYFGFGTYEAVRAFQKVNGLKVDGVVGPATWKALFAASALPKPTASPKP